MKISPGKKIVAAALALLAIAAGISGCSAKEEAVFDIYSVTSYRDIPGIADWEILAIEHIKSTRESLSFGSMPTTEAFTLLDGSVEGFVPMLCDLLSDLFGIPFVHEIHDWEILVKGLGDHSIDFSGDLTPTPERRNLYLMSLPIAERTLSILSYDRFLDGIKTENDINGLRLGFFGDAITAQSILSVYPVLNFKQVPISSTKDIPQMLASGAIDAFVVDSVLTPDFAGYNLGSKEFFSLVYTPVSLATTDIELGPIISVLNKYLAAGGTDRINELYREGNYKYLRHALNQSFSDDELAYLDTLSKNATKVRAIFEPSNYPISFYNERDSKFQGIAVDVLSEITRLTDIEFEAVSGGHMSRSAMLEKLKSGEAALITELSHSEEIANDFLWADSPYAAASFIFLSKLDFPNLEIHQVVRVPVGVESGSVYEGVFDKWFPDHPQTTRYDDHIATLDALERGEVALMLTTANRLLLQVNFREKPEYKANIIIDAQTTGSYFGFNASEEILRSIVSKAQHHVKTETITKYWTSRVFDHSRKFANERFLYTAISASALFVLLVLLLILLFKNNKTKALYKMEAATLSTIYSALPDHVFCKDKNGVYTNCNHVFEELIGRDKSEIIGKTFAEIFEGMKQEKNIPDADRDLLDRKVVEEKTPTKEELWVKSPNGTEKFFETVKVPLIQDGKAIGLLGIGKDMTKHMALLSELNEAHNRAMLMLDASPFCCHLWNRTPDGKLELFDCNNAAVKLFGLKNKQEFIGRFNEFSPEYQSDGQLSSKKALMFVQKALDEGRCVFEWTHQFISGEPVPTMISIERLKYGDDYVALAYLQDMREQKQMTSEIDRQNNLLQMVNLVSSILADPDIEKFDANLISSMNIVGNALDVDRISLWKNHTKDDKLYATMLSEWKGPDTVMSRIGIESSKDVPYGEALPGWYEILSEGKCINSLARDVVGGLAPMLVEWGTLSFFVVPIFMYGVFWGLVAFDDCHKERVFTEGEELILRSASRMMANALVRTDMTQHIRATAVQLETLVANYPGIIWRVDGDGTITLFNGMYVKALGFGPEDVLGKKYRDVKNDIFQSTIVSRIDKTFAGEKQDWVSRTDNGVFHVHTTPILDDKGRISEVVGSVDEITEIIRLQEELEEAVEKANEASKAKSIFLAKMSHEIRTPMNAIIGMAEIALREKTIDTVLKHIATIRQAGANLLAIINDILDISKIESGKLEIIADHYQFSSLINDVISIIRMRAIDSRLRFVVNIDSNIPNEMYGDETRFRQVLINVLSNAVKYTESGFVAFTVAGDIVDEDTVNLTIAVKDSGRGIKQEDIDSLFGDFVQVDAANRKGVEGTGLGLAITRNILKMMNGDIQAASEYGKGSTFTVTLPQKFHSREKLASVKSPKEKSTIVFEHRDIYANSIVSTMDNLGVKCTLASSDAEFRKKMASGKHSFVFIANSLYEQNKQTIVKHGASSKIVLLTEFGETVHDDKGNVLAMPVHCISIANMLNGVSDVYSYKEDDAIAMNFTAPDAKVLVVDDIRTNLKVAEGLLLPYNMQIDLCKSGAEALTAVRSKHYDLVFMDHWMPDMDGIETTKRIREMGAKDPRFQELPIIALTANAVSGTKEMFLASGFNGFLAKPIDTVKLDSILNKWIPREKRMNVAADSGVAASRAEHDAPTAPQVAAFEIRGIDVGAGIATTGSSVERYRDMLAIFHEDGVEKIKELAACLEAGDIPLYTIHAHALKGAMANIGAAELSGAAKALEMAGKQKDLKFIKAHHSGFLADLRTLLNNIQSVLSAAVPEGDFMDPKALRARLGRLRLAIETLDASAMNSTIDYLASQKLAENVSSVIRNISHSILTAEYDEALALTESLLQKV